MRSATARDSVVRQDLPDAYGAQYLDDPRNYTNQRILFSAISCDFVDRIKASAYLIPEGE